MLRRYRANSTVLAYHRAPAWTIHASNFWCTKFKILVPIVLLRCPTTLPELWLLLDCNPAMEACSRVVSNVALDLQEILMWLDLVPQATRGTITSDLPSIVSIAFRLKFIPFCQISSDVSSAAVGHVHIRRCDFILSSGFCALDRLYRAIQQRYSPDLAAKSTRQKNPPWTYCVKCKLSSSLVQNSVVETSCVIS
jgi:hypothetical protein